MPTLIAPYGVLSTLPGFQERDQGRLFCCEVFREYRKAVNAMQRVFGYAEDDDANLCIVFVTEARAKEREARGILVRLDEKRCTEAKRKWQQTFRSSIGVEGPTSERCVAIIMSLI